jgi:type II secretory pathway pseudopilin PulG
MKYFLKDRGFSLVSVIVAAGLIGGLSLVLAKLMENSGKVVRTTEVSLESLEYEALVKDTFRSREACTNTFGKVVNPTDPSITLREGMAPSTGNILDTNELEGKKGIFNGETDLTLLNTLWNQDELVIRGLQLKSMTIPINKVKPDGTTVSNFTQITSTPKTGFFEVYIDLEKTGKAARSFGTRNKRLKLFLKGEVYGTDNKIRWCQLSGGDGTGSGTSTFIPPNLGTLFVSSTCSDSYENNWVTFDLSSLVPPEANKVVLFANCGENIMTLRKNGASDSPLTSADSNSINLNKFGCWAGNNSGMTNIVVFELGADKKIQVHNKGTDCNTKGASLKVINWSK